LTDFGVYCLNAPATLVKLCFAYFSSAQCDLADEDFRCQNRKKKGGNDNIVASDDRPWRWELPWDQSRRSDLSLINCGARQA
jgi:hypothetical protein